MPRPSGRWGGTQRLALALQAALLCPDCQGRSGLIGRSLFRVMTIPGLLCISSVAPLRLLGGAAVGR